MLIRRNSFIIVGMHITYGYRLLFITVSYVVYLSVHAARVVVTVGAAGGAARRPATER